MLDISDRIIWMHDGQLERIADRDGEQIEGDAVAEQTTSPRRLRSSLDR